MKTLIYQTAASIKRRVRHARLRPNVELYRRHYSPDSVANRRFYNVGAGGFSHPCWTNVDYDSDWYRHNRRNTLAGIQYDLLSLEPLPLESDSAEVVYTSHTVEHITDAAAQNLFDEALRVLKPGGYLRVTTPNIDLEYHAYCEGDLDFFYWIHDHSKPHMVKRLAYSMPLNQGSIGQVFLTHFATSASTLHVDGAPQRIDDAELERVFREMEYTDALDYCTSLCPLEVQKRYPGNHINWWNRDKALSKLKQAGFADPYLSAYGQSRCPVLRDLAYFDNTHPKVSLYVEARK